MDKTSDREQRPALIVYTVLFGDYDLLHSVSRPVGDADYVCFTDRPRGAEGWRYVIVAVGDEGPTIANRRLKIKLHPLVLEYERSVYVDSNVIVKSDLAPLAEELLSTSDVAVARHPLWSSLRDEFVACLARQKADRNRLLEQYSKYSLRSGVMLLPASANNIIFRRHVNPALRVVMNRWWDEYRTTETRDQLSLMLLLSESGLEYSLIEENWWGDSKYFDVMPHAEAAKKSPMARQAAGVLSRIRAVYWRAFLAFGVKF